MLNMPTVEYPPVALPTPPRVKGRGPTLSTMHEIETILRAADLAVSLNEIRRRMRAKAVPHRTVRTVVDEFKRLGLVAEGSTGVFWTLNTEARAWKRLRHRRLA